LGKICLAWNNYDYGRITSYLYITSEAFYNMSEGVWKGLNRRRGILKL